MCTANPIIEPPTMVINTVLSVMAYDYPPEKLSVYLSDDGGSSLTFYALLEAAQFSKLWLPFCKKFKVEPRCPEAYFSSTPEPHYDDPLMAGEWSSIKVRFPYFSCSCLPSYLYVLLPAIMVRSMICQDEQHRYRKTKQFLRNMPR